MIYLDNNATTRPAPQVVAAMLDALTTHWHNPSSVHRPGQTARQRVELARQSLANLIGCKPRSIVFTSGGTESIDLAIRGVLAASGKRVLVTSAIEHSAVRALVESMEKEEGAVEAAKGKAIEVRLARLDSQGRVIVESVERLLDADVGLVSLQWANNETGVVHPVHEIGTLCRARGIPFHCDGTQWVGKMPTKVDEPGRVNQAGVVTHDTPPILNDALSADLLTFSPHKFHGPKGVGILYARTGIKLRPRIRGAQERGRRGGTENVPGIIGAGVAAELAMAWLADDKARVRLAGLRDRFETLVKRGVPDARVNGVQSAESGVHPIPGCDHYLGQEWNAPVDRASRPDEDSADPTGRDARSTGAAPKNDHTPLPHTQYPTHDAQKNVVTQATDNATDNRLWNTTNIAFPRLEAEALLLLMSEKGLCASAGAACSSGSLEPSPVLLAMGIPPELAHGSVRFGLSRETTEEEIEAGAKIVIECVARLRTSMTTM